MLWSSDALEARVRPSLTKTSAASGHFQKSDREAFCYVYTLIIREPMGL